MTVYKGKDTKIRIGDGPPLEWKTIGDPELSRSCEPIGGFLVPEDYPVELLRANSVLGFRCPPPADFLPEPDPENFWSSK